MRPSLADFAESRIQTDPWKWPLKNFKTILSGLAADYGPRSVLEVGGGRRPLFTREEAEALGLDYAVNDISRSELDRAPEWVGKRNFDIGGEIDVDAGDRYDLIFSHFVMEHVRHADVAYRNMYRMLNPGGVCINLHPTLFSPPYLVNLVIPEHWSARVLRQFHPRRHDDDIPKFPAYYRLCRSTDFVRRTIQGIGFQEVHIVPIYGHAYFRKIPILREVDDYITGVAKARDYRPLSSYALTIARKAGN